MVGTSMRKPDPHIFELSSFDAVYPKIPKIGSVLVLELCLFEILYPIVCHNRGIGGDLCKWSLLLIG